LVGMAPNRKLGGELFPHLGVKVWVARVHLLGVSAIEADFYVMQYLVWSYSCQMTSPLSYQFLRAYYK